MKTLTFDHEQNANAWPFRISVLDAMPKAGDKMRFSFDDIKEAMRFRYFLKNWNSHSFAWTERQEVFRTVFVLRKHHDAPTYTPTGYIEVPSHVPLEESP